MQKNKKSLLTIFALATSLLAMAMQVNASDMTVKAGVTTDNLFRGESLSTGNPTVLLETKLSGLKYNSYISMDGALKDSTPLLGDGTVTADLGVGKVYSVPRLKTTVDVSLHRLVNNPVVNSSGYNEFRLLADTNFYGDNHLTYGVYTGTGKNKTQYFTLGLRKDGLFVDGLTASATTYVKRVMSTADGYRFNNLELSASYRLTDNLDLTARYSVGGHTVSRSLDGISKITSNDIPSRSALEVRYSF